MFHRETFVWIYFVAKYGLLKKNSQQSSTRSIFIFPMMSVPIWAVQFWTNDKCRPRVKKIPDNDLRKWLRAPSSRYPVKPDIRSYANQLSTKILLGFKRRTKRIRAVFVKLNQNSNNLYTIFNTWKESYGLTWISGWFPSRSKHQDIAAVVVSYPWKYVLI